MSKRSVVEDKIHNTRSAEDKIHNTRSASKKKRENNTEEQGTPVSHAESIALLSPFNTTRRPVVEGPAPPSEIKANKSLYGLNKKIDEAAEHRDDMPRGMLANFVVTNMDEDTLQELKEGANRLNDPNKIDHYAYSKEEKDIATKYSHLVDSATKSKEKKRTLHDYEFVPEPRNIEDDDARSTELINVLTNKIFLDIFENPTDIGNKWGVDGMIDNNITNLKFDEIFNEVKDIESEDDYNDAFFYSLKRSDEVNREIEKMQDPEVFEIESITMSEFDKLISPMGMECVMDNLNNLNDENKRFIGSKYVGSKFVSSDETKKEGISEDTEEGKEEYDDNEDTKRVLLNKTEGTITTREVKTTFGKDGEPPRRSARNIDKNVDDAVVEREVRGRTMTPEDKNNVKQKKDDGKLVLGSTTTLSIGAVPSEYIYELAQKFNLESLIKTTGKNVPETYANLMYDYFKFRRRPDDWQISGATARNTAALGVAEQTQFKDIWGTWIFQYACGMASEWGDDVYEEDYKICCYICKKPIVNAIDKNKVEHGANKRLRTCPEMEHVYPCIKAYSSAPMYLLLDYYKINGKQIHKEWKKYVDVYEIPEERYDALRKLYYEINCEANFNTIEINRLLELIKEDFKVEILEGGRITKYDQKKFDWAFEVIKYWLFEFAYAHHLCNQEKSNLDITNKKVMNKYYNDLRKRWMRTNNADIKDTIDKKEGKHVFGGSKDQKVTVTAYFKKDGVFKKNLNSRFDYTESIINEIGSKYLGITKVDFENFKDDEKIKKISEIALMRSVMLSAKWYKSQVKAKGLENVKGRSKSRSKSPGVKASSSSSSSSSYGKKAKPGAKSVTQKAKPGSKTRKQVRGQTFFTDNKGTLKRITQNRGPMDNFVTMTKEDIAVNTRDNQSNRRAQRAMARNNKGKILPTKSSNRGFKKGKGGRRTRKKLKKKSRRKRIYRRIMTRKGRKN